MRYIANERLKPLILNKFNSVRAFSNHIGYTERAIRMIHKGQSKPHYSTVKAISECLGVHHLYLFKEVFHNGIYAKKDFKEKVKYKGLKYTEIAKAINVSKANFSNISNAVYGVSEQRAIEISSIVGLGLYDLFEWR